MNLTFKENRHSLRLLSYLNGYLESNEFPDVSLSIDSPIRKRILDLKLNSWTEAETTANVTPLSNDIKRELSKRRIQIHKLNNSEEVSPENVQWLDDWLFHLRTDHVTV
eukprot:TRINITY_DN8298_c0_g1_i1.p1 TRINITY_DN8298_c0_g1~~TRINITY_DN8298_c0_g1_i1.p1  ORF type:complete len:109 (+),score=19.44 TRINITY_DN8298_c0_g1_i1:545-871(+)